MMFPNAARAAAWRYALPAAAIALLPIAAVGQEAGQDAYGTLAQQLANPVANLVSVPFQNNFDVGGGRGGDAFRYTLNFQPVVPFTLSPDWNLITRTIVPISHSERLFPDHRTGLGDVLQSFFLSPSRPTSGGLVWGAGPVFLYPTATQGLGTGQWAAGPTGVVLQMSGPWQYGVLANHVWGVGDSSPDRPRVNASFAQPFVVYTFPTHTSVALNAEASYNWDRRQLTLPLNLVVSQLALVGGQPVQFGAGFRYFLDGPASAPDWGVRLNMTLVFPR